MMIKTKIALSKKSKPVYDYIEFVNCIIFAEVQYPRIKFFLKKQWLILFSRVRQLLDRLHKNVMIKTKIALSKISEPVYDYIELIYFYLDCKKLLCIISGTLRTG